MEKQQIINHKEIVEKVLYEKDFFTVSKGKEYPKTKIKVSYITYTGERLDKDGNYQPYEGEKISIVNAKLTSNEGNMEIAKKILYNKNGEAYAVDDKKEVNFSVEEFNDLLTNIDLELEKKN